MENLLLWSETSWEAEELCKAALGLKRSLKRMSGIFISYRRDDSSGHTGRLLDWLAERFNHDLIFRDLQAIALCGILKD